MMDIVKKTLGEAIRSDTLAHAYLFLGPDRNRMSKEALELAKVLSCREKDKNLNSCNSCISCRKIDNFNHPDIGQISAKAPSRQINPHTNYLKNGKRKIGAVIKISQIREVQRQAYLKPIEGNKKIFIIHNADSITQEGSNSLLKILEEPPAGVIFILIGFHLGNILPTIASRCQVIKFSQTHSFTPDESERHCVDEFINIDNQFQTDTLEFIRRPKDEQLRTIDLLLLHFRDKLIKNTENKDTLILMDELLLAKDLLQSNTNVKFVADHILGSLKSYDT